MSGWHSVALPLQMQGWASSSSLMMMVPATVDMCTVGGGIQNPMAGVWHELAAYPRGHSHSSTPNAGSDRLRPGIAVSSDTLRSLDNIDRL